MRRIILLLMLTVAALASVQSQAWASNAYVSPSERTVAVGDQFQLEAYINLNEEETASFEEMEREPSWWSSDNGVAVVDDDGMVRAVGVGTATIRATDDASDAPCVVTVVPRPMTDPIVILSSNTLYLYIDETYDESMYHYPEFSDNSSSELHVYSRTNEISVESVTWMSSNGDVASVHDGVVSAGRAGHTTITATVEIDGTVHELTCEVTVSDGYLHGVEIWQGDRCIAGGAGADVQVELVVGETAELRAESSSGEDISEFDWESSDESVATVVNGIVTAVGAGEAEITVIARGDFELFSEEANIMHCTVTVLPLHISAESISLDHSELSLTDGETATLTATVLPDDATDKGVTWSSSDTSVATVDANGTVTAVAAGTATITATTTDGSNLSASCTVTVTEPEHEYYLIGYLDTQEAFTNDNGVFTLSKRFEWLDGDDGLKFLVRDENGNMYGRGQLTKASPSVTLTPVTTSSESDWLMINPRCEEPFEWVFTLTIENGVLTVTDWPIPPESMSIDPSAITLTVGDSYHLSKTVLPENYNVFLDYDTYWESSNGTVAAVDYDGNVTAIAPGTATINAYLGGGAQLVDAQCVVTVVPVPATTIALNHREVTLTEGETLALTATVLPADAAQSVTWSSSDTSVATVVNGVVTAVAAGTATITATTADGTNLSASCAVTVNPLIIIAESIVLDHSELSLTEGETATLTATVLPEDATDKGVTWSSSDTSVATVENGVVTAVAAGTATITATTADGTNLSASCAVTVSALQPANALAVADYNCYAGDTFTVDVLMNNEDAIGGMQFDLYLPEGFSVALNKKGKPDITLDEDRIEDHQLMVNSNFADGHLNVLAFSLDNEPFYGTDGAVLHIGLVADADAAIGLHELEFRNIELSSPDGLQQYLADRLAGRIEVLPVLVESIALDRVSATLYDDESLTLTATVLPENATNRVVAWSSSDENVAMVDADGVVTPVSPGAAVITASTTDGTALSATCEVTILESVYELAVSDSECMAGETFEIQVEMNNTGAIGGVQFDLYLPEGFSVALNNKGKPDITLAEERTDGHQLMVNGNFADGHLNVLAFSMDNEAFVGNAGSVLLINVKADEGVRGGIHELELRDIELSSPDGFQQHLIASLTASIKVKVMGDANDDGLVTVSDVLIVARRANGYAVAGVDDTLIDINGDGRISVRDLLAVAKIANEASHAPSSGAPMRRAPMRVGSVLPGDNRLDITAIDRTPDGTFVLPVAVVNSSEIGGLQFDLHLPEGVSIARDNDGSARVWLDAERTAGHTLMLNDTSDDGHLHVMVFSADNSPLTGVDGTVVNVMLSVDPTIGGDAAVELRNIELASPNGDSYVRPADVAFALGIDGTLTGIDGIMNDADGDGLYYNLLGVPVQHPTPGIYIHNGKKVVVK